MGNMPTHCETNSFSSTNGHSIEPIPKTSSQNGFPQESFNGSKVGLGILNPVVEETKTNSLLEVSDEASKGKNTVLEQQFKVNVSSSSPHSDEPFFLIDKENILLTRENKVHQENKDSNESFGGSDDCLPKCLSKDEIGASSETSLLPKPTELSYEMPVSITANEILLSEDYTRVTCYGPNPKITHIFYGFSLECHPNELVISFGEKREFVSIFHQVATNPSGSSSDSSSQEFVGFCDACNKKLKEEEDQIYIYRGDSLFCSHECLSVGILAEEITKAANKYSSKIPSVSSSDDEDDDVVFLVDEATIPSHPNGQ